MLSSLGEGVLVQMLRLVSPSTARNRREEGYLGRVGQWGIKRCPYLAVDCHSEARIKIF
jgi:hypothetical protein